jgi:hypothetical protein
MNLVRVQYWCLPEEEVEFVERLMTTGDIVAFPSPPTKSAPMPIREMIEKKNPETILISTREFLKRIGAKQSHQQGTTECYLSVFDHPVVGYARGWFYPSGELGSSLLWAYTTYLDKNRRLLVAKDPEFKKWVQKLLRWVRKWTPDYYQSKGYRLTAKVKTAIQNGDFEISTLPGPPRRGVKS